MALFIGLLADVSETWDGWVRAEIRAVEDAERLLREMKEREERRKREERLREERLRQEKAAAAAAAAAALAAPSAAAAATASQGANGAHGGGTNGGTVGAATGGAGPNAGATSGGGGTGAANGSAGAASVRVNLIDPPGPSETAPDRVQAFIGRLKSDPDGSMVIGRRELVTVRVPVNQAQLLVQWEFATDSYDIMFGVSFESGEGESKKEEVLLPSQRYESHADVIHGGHVSPGAGAYLLRFDNSYSILRSKTLYYHVVSKNLAAGKRP
jgi:hypothetical protein